jgi:signal transduction histidine kinase
MNEKLSRAVQAKDQFLANMSHELRTPLTAILGKTEVLQEGIYGSLTDKQARAIDIIGSSGSHLLALINDILDVARIEAGRLEINWEPVSLKAVCDAAKQFVIQEAQTKNITIHISIDERVQIIHCDNRRITQIIVNLLNNAVKFTPEGGEIGLEIKSDLPNDQVKIIVWDTGIGISEEGKQILFGELSRPKPFVQIENSLSRQYQGSGLGLTIVYSLTQLHNGSINIESKAGQGTTITVSLPINYSNSDLEEPNEPKNDVPAKIAL